MDTPTPDGPGPKAAENGLSVGEIVSRGYAVHYEDWFKKGFELFRQEGTYFAAYLVVLMLAYGVVGSVPMIGKFTSMIVGPFVMGMLLMAFRIDKQMPRRFESFFHIRMHYQELLLVVFIQSLITYTLTLLVLGWGNFLIYMGWREVDYSDLGTMLQVYSGIGKRYVLVWLPMLLITTLWLFAPCFVIFRGYKAWDAMEASRKLVMPKFANWLGFVVLAGLFNIAGAICLVIGLLVTIPTSMCAVYVAYDAVVGAESTSGN